MSRWRLASSQLDVTKLIVSRILPCAFLPARDGSDVQKEHHWRHHLDSPFTEKGAEALGEEKPAHVCKDLEGRARSASQGSWPRPLCFQHILPPSPTFSFCPKYPFLDWSTAYVNLIYSLGNEQTSNLAILIQSCHILLLGSLSSQAFCSQFLAPFIY